MESSRTQNRMLAVVKSRAMWAVAAVMVALVAIFPLGAWAEAAEWHHALQHIMIFLAGTVLGSTIFSDLFNGKEVK